MSQPASATLPNTTASAAFRAALLLAGCLAAAAASVLATAMPGVGKLLWLPSGLGLGVLALAGLRYWPAVALAGAAFALLSGQPPVLSLTLGIAAGLEACMGAWVLRRAGWRPGTLRLKHMLLLAGVAFGASLLGGTVEYFVIAGRIAGVEPATLWWACWLGHSLGTLLVAPLVLGWGLPQRGEWSVLRAAELAIIFIATAALSVAVFGAMGDPNMFNPLPYALFPLLLWAALRFSVREVAALLVLAALLASWGTANGNGPFALPSKEMSLGSLYLYLSVASVAALVLVAAVEERARAEERSRQHLQQLAQVSRALALGEMGSAIAHELNQPLAAVVTYAQAARRLMAAGDTGPDVQRAMDRIAAQAERAGEILRRLRGFLAGSGAERGETDLNRLVHEVVELARPEARQCQTTLELALAGDLPTIQADAVQVQQVLLNLVRNACEALAQAGSAVRTVSINTRAEGDGVAVAVSDSGPGVPAGQEEQVFEPFFSTKATGTGIGLAISRSIAESHAGALRLERAAEGGARFVLWLPRAI